MAILGLEAAWASPDTLDRLYLDDSDHHGIMWWANKIHEQNEKMKSKNGS